MNWKEWLEERRGVSTMAVEEIPLMEVRPPWGIQADGKYRREPEAFFSVIGLKIQAKREVPAWTQPALREVGQGVCLLIKCGENFLVAAKEEPGNPPDKSFVMLAPTVQASKSNLEAAHSGKRPPRAELLDKYPVTWVEIPQDGGRFFGKVNNYGVVEVEEEIIPLTNERWFTREELREAYLSGDVNEHLTQALMGAII